MTMKGFLSDELLLNLRNITHANISLISKKCTHLGENQITWRPSKDAWNIQEVLSHLNSYSTYYHQVFLDKIQNTKFKNVKEHRSEEHTSELQSRPHLVCRLLLEKKKKKKKKKKTK